MYVHEEGVTGPPPHFSNCVPRDSLEVHCHGSSGAEGVGADIACGVSKGCESQGGHRKFDGLVNVVTCEDASGAGRVRKVGTNDLCGITVMGSDVFEAAYNGKDGTANISSCFMVDDGSPLAILLV